MTTTDPYRELHHARWSFKRHQDTDTAKQAPAILDHNLSASPADQHLVGDRYRTLSRIGKGRLGDIFSATDENLEKLGVEQHVAVQLIPTSIVGNNKLFNKLNVGFTTLKAGAHPNIVEYSQLSRDGEIGLLSMELLEGASLRTLLEKTETLPVQEVKSVVRGVGEALGYLHAKDIVHGNLTTGNVFVGEDLEPRLLDVVPLGSGDAIFPGATTSGSFGRCTVQDDVFGLACLAYEMLSGKHPYNYCPPGEARLAGLEAERIASLADSDWDALRLALSLELDERTSSVREFTRGFGILGTERLRSTPDSEQHFAAEEYTRAAKVPPIQEVPDPAPRTSTLPTQSIDWFKDDLPGTPSRRGSWFSLRAVFLSALLAALVGWTYYGQPEEQFVDAISYVDEAMSLGLVQRGDNIATEWVIDLDQQEKVNAPAAFADVPKTDTEELVEQAVAESTEEIPELPPAADIEETELIAREANDDLVLADSPSIDQPLDTVVAKEAEKPAVAINTVVVEPYVAVSERDAAARIPLRHNTDSTTQLMWWTSNDTANGDQDFIAVRQRIMTETSLDQDSVLHIPLINDGVREPRESFYVNFGLRSAEQGTIERVATVRVDIIDDDLT